MEKKRLYWNSCSFLYELDVGNYCSSYKLWTLFQQSDIDITKTDKSFKASIKGNSNESIFRRTIIECSKNKFDFVIIGWTHPERYFTIDTNNEIDYRKLREDAERISFNSKIDNEIMYGYKQQIPYSNPLINQDFIKFEPKGTDDTIFYTISLHHFFKQKNIPHLFLNMGKLSDNVLWARESWLSTIDSKNYLSLNDDDNILQKMQFSFVEYFLKLDGKSFYKDKEINILNNIKMLDISNSKKFYTNDDSGHLSNNGFAYLSKLIYNHIVTNDLI